MEVVFKWVMPLHGTDVIVCIMMLSGNVDFQVVSQDESLRNRMAFVLDVCALALRSLEYKHFRL